MSDNSAIEWTDATWNPVTGCTEVSPGCDHCYAKTFAERWRGTPGHHFENGFDVTLRPERLDQPLKWRKPRRVFVNSMSDLFHEAVPDEFIATVFARMWWSPQHTFQVLTKRHGRMRSLVPRLEERLREMERDLDLLDAPTPLRWPLPNVWLGCSVETQQWADIRIPALLDTPAAVRFLSCEPLLGPIDLRRISRPSGQQPEMVLDVVGQRYGVPGRWQAPTSHRIDWVIAGGESGPGARPMHPSWPRSLRDQCQAAGVPYFLKQWGEWGLLPKVQPNGAWANNPGITVTNDGTVYQPGDLAYPDGPRYGEAIRAGHDKAALHAMYRVGKKAAGRELDGRTWDECPAVTR